MLGTLWILLFSEIWGPASESTDGSDLFEEQRVIFIFCNDRSEGLSERDISSLGVMGWGLEVAENSSAAAQRGVNTGLWGQFWRHSWTTFL